MHGFLDRQSILTFMLKALNSIVSSTRGEHGERYDSCETQPSHTVVWASQQQEDEDRKVYEQHSYSRITNQ